MGYVFTVFQLAYGLFEIPTGRWADRMGTRLVLTRIVIWWSGVTAATAAAINYPVLLAIRFLFGAGEAGAWPCVARTFSRWIPRRERGTRPGHFLRGRPPGRRPDAGPGALACSASCPGGVFVSFGQWAWCGPRSGSLVPRRSVGASAVNAAELARSSRPSPGSATRRVAYWRQLIRSRNMLALCVMYIPNGMIFYFCITWLPTYLRRGTASRARPWPLFAGLPLIVSVPGDLFGGLADPPPRLSRYGLRVGRCGLGAATYLAVGLVLMAAAASSSAVLAAILIAAAPA